MYIVILPPSRYGVSHTVSVRFHSSLKVRWTFTFKYFHLIWATDLHRIKKFSRKRKRWFSTAAHNFHKNCCTYDFHYELILVYTMPCRMRWPVQCLCSDVAAFWIHYTRSVNDTTLLQYFRKLDISPTMAL